MCLKLNELVSLYSQAKLDNPNLFIYNDLDTLECDSIFKESYDLNIKLIKADNKYKIFVFIGKDSKLIFNCLLVESTDNLQNEYDTLKSEINNLTLTELFDKYYKKLKMNL